MRTGQNQATPGENNTSDALFRATTCQRPLTPATGIPPEGLLDFHIPQENAAALVNKMQPCWMEDEHQ